MRYSPFWALPWLENNLFFFSANPYHKQLLVCDGDFYYGKTAMIKLYYLFLTLIGCPLCLCDRRNHPSTSTRRSIESILKEYVDQWMAVEGVVGVYQGEQDGKACIKIMVVQQSKHLESQLPKEVEDYTVVIEETGVIRPL